LRADRPSAGCCSFPDSPRRNEDRNCRNGSDGLGVRRAPREGRPRGVGHRSAAGAHRRHHRFRSGVSGASGSFVVDNLHVGRSVSDAGTCGVFVIATKAADVDAVAAEIAPLLEPDSIVMAFQNGLGEGDDTDRRNERRPDRPRPAARAVLGRGRLQRPRLRRRHPHDLGEVPLHRDPQRALCRVRRHGG
jgi:hypothetical protein